jgi:hypothetical protein
MKKLLITESERDNILSMYNNLDITTKIKLSEQDSRTPNKYECVPLLFAPVISDLLSKGYDKRLLKASLGVIGRESDFGNSTRYQMTTTLKSLLAYLGGQTSVGLGQIKPETAKKFGLSVTDLNSAHGSLKGVYEILKNNYTIALQNGYSNDKPSVNLTQGTGSAALDMAIIAFNLGASKITKYCKTNDPNVKRPCNMAGKTIQEQRIETVAFGDNKPKPQTNVPQGSSNPTTMGPTSLITVTKEWVPNYLPNYKSERWDKVNITTHGYVKEVAQKMKMFGCF